LTHGARAVLLAAQPRTAPQRLTRLQQWAVALAARRGHNKAAIGLANKLPASSGRCGVAKPTFIHHS